MNERHTKELPTKSPGLEMQRIADSYLAAWRARDPARIIAMHTPDTRFELHIGIPAATGREAVQAAFARTFEQWPGFAFDVHRLLLGPGHWILDWTMRASVARQVDGRTVTKEVGVGCVDVVVLSPEGLVARKDTYVDAADLRNALA